jgi:amino acid transporter
MGSPGGALGLMFLVLVITLLCSISITVAASRATWAFARDDAIPGAKLWAKVDTRLGVPMWALALTTIVQALLGLINLGSSSAFIAFVSVGVQALALSYGLPVALSLWAGRREVNQARWTMGKVIGPIINGIALLWITFELVLFSMPTALPVTPVTMNYASVVLVGFGTIATVWYIVHARKGTRICSCCNTGIILTLLQSTRAHRLQKVYKEAYCQDHACCQIASLT